MCTVLSRHSGSCCNILFRHHLTPTSRSRSKREPDGSRDARQVIVRPFESSTYDPAATEATGKYNAEFDKKHVLNEKRRAIDRRFTLLRASSLASGLSPPFYFFHRYSILMGPRHVGSSNLSSLDLQAPRDFAIIGLRAP